MEYEIHVAEGCQIQISWDLTLCVVPNLYNGQSAFIFKRQGVQEETRSEIHITSQET
jgi:hypothetical protein